MALRALDLERFGEMTPVAISALIEIVDPENEEDPEASIFYFMAPAGGGVKLDVEGQRIHVLTPTSPLGRVLIGAISGDEFEYQTPKGLRNLIVKAVR